MSLPDPTVAPHARYRLADGWRLGGRAVTGRASVLQGPELFVELNVPATAFLIGLVHGDRAFAGAVEAVGAPADEAAGFARSCALLTHDLLRNGALVEVTRQ